MKAGARRQLRHRVSAFVRGVLRRQADQLLPSREAREYKLWMAGRLKERRALYQNSLEPGLLTVITAVWNGSPVSHLRVLARSLLAQNAGGECEWVILDNGCSKRALLACLQELSAHSWIKLHNTDTNIGIVRGLRTCLERAAGRYVLPVDADDYLYPDALRVVTSHVRSANYPALLYSDEDKVIGRRIYQPYLKPDWDPVLLLNSAYIAHLGVIDRKKALELGAYSDASTEGSADWDLFVRFVVAGYAAVHIPEVLYSWRAHAQSTADDASTKPYIHASQKAVLQRFLDAQPEGKHFDIECSPLLGGAAHWHFARQHVSPRPMGSILIGTGSSSIDFRERARVLLQEAHEMAKEGGLIHLRGEQVEIEDPEWLWEAMGLFEMHADAVMIGGRIRNRKGLITDAGRHFGFGGVCGCPDRDRSFLDPGYFAQMFKQRSVSAVTTQFAVVRATFLEELLRDIPANASVAFLGAWAGAYALRTRRRVVYSPFLSGISDLDWETLVEDSEQELFREMNPDVIPDRRFYSRSLSLVRGYEVESNLH